MFYDLTSIRYQIYSKIESLLEKRGELTGPRRKMLAKRYYEYLRCFARYDSKKCRSLLTRIHRLDPDFGVDRSCEPDARALWFIQHFGLSVFLLGYGVLCRLADKANAFRRESRRLLTASPVLKVD